ncbi:hypothetical protein KQI68_06475 [Peptoniphilus sp. MSJ-1]|uniref:Uncharacterized protein n=1 Tax=Peptoniphilus ovalis TaxID=2841503 RepID=A0ABS6FJ02_9FIRM|nr:hypothetical protein [Peptoniphilus ovalis]MBU5669482.1 hypothetical protein [Peptoniphilus ovalis]
MKKLNKFIKILKGKYPYDIFCLKKDNGFYVVLMKNRELINDKTFEEYFYKSAFDLFGEYSYRIYPCLDYLEEIK